MWRILDLLKVNAEPPGKVMLKWRDSNDHAITQKYLREFFSLKARLGHRPRMLHLGSAKPGAKTFPRPWHPNHALHRPQGGFTQVSCPCERRLGLGEWQIFYRRVVIEQRSPLATCIPFHQGQPLACCSQIGQSWFDKALPISVRWKSSHSSFSLIHTGMSARSSAGTAAFEDRIL